MSNEQNITITGRMVNDAELRFTPSGAAVANFSVAFTPRRFDKQSSQWVDGTTQWWRCAAWNAGKLTLAENICDQLKKGDAVVVVGTLEAREYETREGEKRTVTEVRVQHIGKDALYHGQPHSKPAQAAPQQGGNGWGGQQQDDPWAQPAQQSGGWGTGGGTTEPPF